MTCYKPRCYFCQVYAGRLNRSYRSCKCPRQIGNCDINNNINKRRCVIRYRKGCSGDSFGITEAGFGPQC